MVYKVTYDKDNHPVKAEAWPELTMGAYETQQADDAYQLKDYTFIEADNEQDAMKKAADNSQ